MKRRAVLAAAGFALSVGSLGCSMPSGDDSKEFRLWFVRILNDRTGGAGVGVRILDGSRTVAERRWDALPGRSADESPGEATFACEANIRMMNGEWSGSRREFDVEFSVGGTGSWETLGFDRPAVNLAIDLHVFPGANPPETLHEVLEFESAEQASTLLEDATAECQE